VPMSPSARRVRPLVIVLCVAGMLAAACSSGGGSATTDPTAAPDGSTPPVDATEVLPPEAREHASDWPLPGRDHANSRAVPDSASTTETVEGLRVAWEARLEGQGSIGNAATTPLILGDRVVVQDLASNVRVFDREDGDLVWETRVDEGNIGPNGVAVG